MYIPVGIVSLTTVLLLVAFSGCALTQITDTGSGSGSGTGELKTFIYNLGSYICHYVLAICD